MTPEMRQKIASEVREHLRLTREQYTQLCLLAEELDLEIVQPELSWDELLLE